MSRCAIDTLDQSFEWRDLVIYIHTACVLVLCVPKEGWCRILRSRGDRVVSEVRASERGRGCGACEPVVASMHARGRGVDSALRVCSTYI